MGNSCGKCGHSIDTNANYLCPNCGQTFWQSEELFRKNGDHTPQVREPEVVETKHITIPDNTTSVSQYLGKFIGLLLAWAFGILVFGGWIITLFPDNYQTFLVVIAGVVALVGASYSTYSGLVSEAAAQEKARLKEAETQINESIVQTNAANQEIEILKSSIKEKSAGFPTLLEYIATYEKVRDDYLAGYLAHKPHPALSSAQIVKEEARRRREAEFQNKKTKSIIEYYESIAPFLLDFKEEIIEDEDIALQEFTEEEQADPVSNFLTKEEYRKLPSAQRNQMALDRYWKRPKSKWLIGRMYERYIGYLYEKEGYDVNYHGIFQGYEDLGRDLICNKGKNFLIVQCKHWSQFKTIHEKHIFQLFGTFFQYKDANPDKKPKAVFYTSTSLSDLARRFANELDIDLVENCKMDTSYPCIKCNIGKNKEKIYHLPFDQQYDNTNIEIKKGEFYCSTVAEAEKAGFRRAYRWHGVRENN